MEAGFDFRDLFVLDLANNHQGDVEHGLRVIREVGEVIRAHGVRAAFKFQFRDLDSFVHPSHREDHEHKHIQRFLKTRLSRDEFQRLLDAVRELGQLAACTPFDEPSVDQIEQMGFDIVKVASCSARDWPLIERIARANKPVIFSTGGSDTPDIDNIVSFCNHKGVDFAMMHCVAVYPTPAEACHLAQIRFLAERFPGVTIGWSTHEDPQDTEPVMVAHALGARIFERHVGVATESVKLNAYSSTPRQVDAWIAAWKKARALAGSGPKPKTSPLEVTSIDSLQRGVYARRGLRKGASLSRSDVYFAIPFLDGQLASGAFRDGIVLEQDLTPDQPLHLAEISLPEEPDRLVIQHALHQVRAMLNQARIPLGVDFRVEYSHQYGIRNFHETGAVLIDLVNRQYCKKLIIQLPGQRNPSHFHKLKEETFNVLFGQLELELDGQRRTLRPGERILIQPGVWHSFWGGELGVIFEELSTTHYNDDSYYRDKRINAMKRSERKTVVDHWGRFQLQ
jgi:sialic acid synthase SpsE/mannose-6-phosphate isomerase-like protein (cupin superfamily)